MDRRRAALYESIVQDAFQFVAVLRVDMSVAFVSAPVKQLLGYAPSELEGRSVADFLHTDDVERAVMHLAGWDDYGVPNGATSFRLRHADGRWLQFDVTAAHVNDGPPSAEDTEGFLAVYAQPADYQHATDSVLAHLLQGTERAEALRPVVDIFAWALNDAHVAITWHEPGVGLRYVSTGIPGELAGAVARTGGPWETARTTLAPVLDLDHSTLTREQAGLARRLNRGGVWIVPVDNAGSDQPALITVWSRTGGPPPDGHAYGMSIATTYVELILCWSSQAERLNEAAHRDPLTGLRNRTALFDALSAQDQPGALLFCDLDHFKPVNDQFGHTVGDEVLCHIARRIERCARSTDLVARTGGDEFVVLARGATAEQTAALAQRIRNTVMEPVSVDGHLLEVGVTIGVAHADDRLTEDSLIGADQALMRAKAAERGTVRWHP